MDRQRCRHIGESFLAALETVAADLNVRVEYRGGSFDGGSFKPKFVVSEIAADGTVLTPERTDFLRYATSYGLDADWLEKEFHTHQGVFKVVGLNTRARKTPVIAEMIENGKKYRFPANSIKNAFEQSGKLKTALQA